MINYVLEGNFKTKWYFFLKNKHALLGLLLLFITECFWLVFTKDFSNGYTSLRIKLPLLVLPLVIGTTSPLKTKEWKVLLSVFLISLCLSGLVVFLVKYNFINPKINTGTNRDLSIFMSHIRYSILLSFGFFLLGYLFYIKKLNKGIATVSMLLLVIVLYQLNSFTSYIALIVVVFFIFFQYIRSLSSKYKLITITSFFIFLVLGFLHLNSIYHNLNTPKNEVVNNVLPVYSKNGEKYIHDTSNLTLENGYYLWRNIAEKELATAWNGRSDISFYANDRKDQEIKYTIYRYLTSMGLKKDENALKMLDSSDILAIENGQTTVIKYNLFEKRLRSLIFELQQYYKTKNPNNQTLIQRFFYWKVAIQAFSKHWFFGYGTGGYKEAIRNEYKTQPNLLATKNQKYPHNQFLTQLINLGIVGFLIWLIVLVYPMLSSKVYRHPLFNVFVILMIVSMLSDDMLERQVGVCIFSFIYTLFVTQHKEINYSCWNKILKRSS